MKFWHKITALGLAAAGLLLAGVLSPRSASSPEQMFSRLSDRLLCQCGCGQHLNGCNMHPCGSAYPMRDQIREAIAAGKNEDAIVEEFVQQMGAGVLAAPRPRGIGLAAWIMPVVALLLGLSLIFLAVKRWRARPAAVPAGPSAPAAAADAALKRYTASIDEELEREA